MGPILFTARVNVPTHFLGSEFVPWRPQEPRTPLPTERDQHGKEQRRVVGAEGQESLHHHVHGGERGL